MAARVAGAIAPTGCPAAANTRAAAWEEAGDV